MGNTITARERPGDLPCSLLGSVRERNDHVRELSQLHLAWPGSQAGTETVRANNHQASCRIYYGTTDRLLIENIGIFVISGVRSNAIATHCIYRSLISSFLEAWM